MSTQESYDTEASLVSAGTALFPKYLQDCSRSWRLAHEVGVGRSIADIVVATGPAGNWETLPYGLTAFESVIVSCLRNVGRMRIEDLERSCAQGKPGLRARQLDRLLLNGVIERDGRGMLAIADWWLKDITIIAIEAKLTRWKSALEQAAAYTSFADETYVLLPPNFDRRLSLMESEFGAAGVGLLTIKDDELVRVLNPRRMDRHDWRREFVYSRVAVNRIPIAR